MSNPIHRWAVVSTVAIAFSGIILSGVIGGAVAQDVGTPSRHERADRPLPSETIDARLAYLKTALKITDAQTAQWSALADVMRQQAKSKDQLLQKWRAAEKSGERDRQSAIDRLQHAQEMSARHAEELGALLSVAKPLYASFTVDQKKVADDVLSHPPGHGAGHEGHGPDFH